ncbi:hypothetical protein PTKIN_Ptkin06aG0091100 [Pterospermum kingtungense]
MEIVLEEGDVSSIGLTRFVVVGFILPDRVFNRRGVLGILRSIWSEVVVLFIREVGLSSFSDEKARRMRNIKEVNVKGYGEEMVGICNEIEGLKLKGEVGNRFLDGKMVDKGQCNVIMEELDRVEFCVDRNSDGEILPKGNSNSILEYGTLVKMRDEGVYVKCEGDNILDGVVNILKKNDHNGEKDQSAVDGVVLSIPSVVEGVELNAMREGVETQVCPYSVKLPSEENSDLVVVRELKQYKDGPIVVNDRFKVNIGQNLCLKRASNDLVGDLELFGGVKYRKLDEGGKFRMVDKAIGE